MVVSAWQAQNKNADDLLSKLSDEQLSKETAPGRNTGTYLLGHLAAVNDNMIPILDFGDRLYPDLEDIFLRNPDNPEMERPPVAELRKYWKEINTKLDHLMNDMQPDEWFEKHRLVSEDDFSREPHRNKLNILINRANHQSYHLGQLVYLVNN